MQQKYTLDTPTFKSGLIAGISGANNLGDLPVMLVGGGAIQYYSHKPSLRRPTIDVDLQTKTHLVKSRRTAWGKEVIKILQDMGISSKYRQTHTGAEVRLNVDKGNFFAHLDVYTNGFLRKHQAHVERSFERSRLIKLEEYGNHENHKVQAPEDVMAHKLTRLCRASQIEGRLSDEDKLRVNLLTQGLIDDVDVGTLEDKLKDIQEFSQATMEEITRNGFENSRRLYNKFKDKKSLFDVLLLVASHRNSPIFVDPKLIKKEVEELTT